MESRKFWNSRIETLSRDKLERLQLERLRRQIKRCHERSSFYEENFKKAGVWPKHLSTLKDIAKFPFITKGELRDEQVKHPTFGRYALASPKNWREFHPSSGTTGNPVNTIWSERDVETITDVTARTMWSFGIRSQDIVQNSLSYGLWVAGLSVHYACKRIGCFVIPSSTVSTARQIEFMKNPGATVLLATPSFALYIAERLKEQGIYPDEIPLRRGCFGGEAGTEIPSTRAKLKKDLELMPTTTMGLPKLVPLLLQNVKRKPGSTGQKTIT
jgi:phenylacetate-CoA ligase